MKQISVPVSCDTGTKQKFSFFVLFQEAKTTN